MTQEEFNKRFWEYREEEDLKSEKFTIGVASCGCGILIGILIGFWIASFY